MFSSIIKSINWVDICVIILLLRICYIALKNGFVHEIFKVFATVTALYFSLHYYSVLAGGIRSRLNLNTQALVSLDFFIFITLVILVYLVFFFLRKIFSKALKIEIIPALNKWGSFIFGLARALLLASLLMFMLLLSGVGFLNRGVQESYCARYIAGIAPAVYSSLWHGIFSKFFSGEKFNDNTLEAQSLTPA